MDETSGSDLGYTAQCSNHCNRLVSANLDVSSSVSSPRCALSSSLSSTSPPWQLKWTFPLLGRSDFSTEMIDSPGNVIDLAMRCQP